MTKVLAVISFIDQHGNPVDPGFGGGIPGGVDPGFGVGSGLHPSHGLPSAPGHPSNRPPGSYPGRPDNSLPGGGHVSNRPPGSRPGRPDNSLPWNPNVGVWPPDETDPDWGVDVGYPSHPIYVPIDPARPDNSLPPIADHKPLPNPPPGTIWPPLPGNPPPGKAALLVWLVGVGWRYFVVDIQPGHPSQQPIPGTPPRPGQLPGQTPQPK